MANWRNQITWSSNGTSGGLGIPGLVGLGRWRNNPPKKVCEIAFLGEKFKLFDFWQNEILVKLHRFVKLYVYQSLLRVDSHFLCEDHGTPSSVQSRTLWHWTHRKQTSKSWFPKQMDCTTGGHEYSASQGLWKSIDISNPVSGSMIKLLEELCEGSYFMDACYITIICWWFHNLL